jgi:hypothetical protein
MDDRPTIRNVVYTHSVLEGTAYEAVRLPDEAADPVFWKRLAPGATQLEV